MKLLTERQMNANLLLKEGDYPNIRVMLDRLCALYPDKNILGELDSHGNIVHYTSTDIKYEVMNLGDGLIAQGLKDAHIAILSDNCCRYVLSDISISSGVGVVVPIDKDAEGDLLHTLLTKADVNAAMCSARFIPKLEAAKESCPLLKTIITMDEKVEGYPYYEELVAKGSEIAQKGESIMRNIELDVDATAKILFTSGTTGTNKGVALTNANLAANMINCMDVILADKNENVSMSVLPMHHATEINTHIMARIGSGRLTYICSNMRDMMRDFKIFKPNIVTIVPMVANVFYKTIWANAAKQGKAEKLSKGIKVSNLLRAFGKDKTHEMFKDLYEPFGGRLKIIVCGGSMLNPVVVKGMNDLGIHIENGYGITECGPLISMNADTLKEHLSVGKACPQLEAKIMNPDENGVGELAVRGKSVAKGYYKDEEATAAAFLPDGFFMTGDSARMDEEGKIFLTGKKKNVIVLQNGKNICPEELENLIEAQLPYVNEAVVYQASNDSGVEVLCAGLWIENKVARNDRNKIQSDICKVNSKLPSYKAIEYVELPECEYPKTSTRKIKRTGLPETCSGKGFTV